MNLFFFLLLPFLSHRGPIREPEHRFEDPAALLAEAVYAEAGSVDVRKTTVLLEHDGLRLERDFWIFEGVTGFAWRASIPLPGDPSVVSADKATSLSRLVPYDEGPWAAINGGFYGAGPLGLVKQDGFELAPLTPRGGTGVFMTGPDGPHVVHRDACCVGATHALQSIDLLVADGLPVLKEDEGVQGEAARAAVAIGGGRLHLVVLAARRSIRHKEHGADLSRTVGNGVPLWAFADYLVHATRAKEALNLDGAQSASMSVAILGERFDIVGEGSAMNAIVIRPKDPVVIPLPPLPEPAPEPAPEP